jgi:membrane protease YdiL (CAAX protease family)
VTVSPSVTAASTPHLGPTAALALLVGGLAAANVIRSTIVPGGWHLAFNLGIGAFAVGVAVAAGLGAAELGLDRATLGPGLRLGGAAFGVVTLGVIVLGLLGVLTDDRADVSAGSMLVRALVVIPLGTVLVEELAFRGTLHALLQRVGGAGWTWVGGAVLFGLWHVFPAWRGGAVDTDLAEVGRVATTAATLLATTGAGVVFVWLRVRSDSLVAPVLAHLATNSVTFALAWLFR